ncbi:MAG TPA: N-acetylneuraminate synthase family protein [Acidimicrobiales bacterium]
MSAPWDDTCLVIAEVAQSHDGSLGTAHAFIDAAAAAGAGAIKFQTHIAAAESTPAEPWRVRFSAQDETRYAYWQRMEFSEEQWAGLAAHAADAGVLFMSSAFSMEAVELLHRVGMGVWKVASGEVGNLELLDAMVATGGPVLLSSGMSPWTELDAAVARVRDAGVELAVLQCTSDYPTAPSQVGLNLLAELAGRYGVPVGLSDHSGTIYPGLAAVTLGAQVIEVHLALSRGQFGPDVAVSLTPDELRQLVDGVAYVSEALANPLDKDAEAARLAPMRDLFTRSLALRGPLAAGSVLTAADLVAKKPGTGISPTRRAELVGRRLVRDLPADHLVELADLADTDAAPDGAP